MMAPITNAERQAQYRKRLKERASLDALGARAGDAVDQAIVALWEVLRRPDDSGQGSPDVDDINTLDEFRAYLADEAKTLAFYCRHFREHPPARMTPDEVKAVTIVADIADAIELTAERPKAGKGRGK